MGMDKDALLGLHKELVQALRVNYYPPCCNPDKVLGFSPHSDSGTITILMQEDIVSGLQVKHGGRWVPVKPTHNALVVMLEMLLRCLSTNLFNIIAAPFFFI